MFCKLEYYFLFGSQLVIVLRVLMGFYLIAVCLTTFSFLYSFSSHTLKKKAKRLAMYQEADSEDEETSPKVGTLSQRDSISSHQSIKVPYRNQSVKSHRRTGSRVEAKRASILSKHTAFSSPMVSKDGKVIFYSNCSLSTTILI